jgi:hypothetical protein
MLVHQQHDTNPKNYRTRIQRDLEQHITQVGFAAFLDAHITLPRVTEWAVQGYSWLYGYYQQPPRLSAEELAQELLGIAEFRALQLGTWLGTTHGQIIAEAVEVVAPPFYLNTHAAWPLSSAIRFLRRGPPSPDREAAVTAQPVAPVIPSPDRPGHHRKGRLRESMCG